MTAGTKIAEHLRKTTDPLSVAEIAAALKIKPATAKAALFKMVEQGKAVYVGKRNGTKYAAAPEKPPERQKPKAPPCLPPSVCNGSMRAPLVYSRMHSERPGAMDYQSIPSLVGGHRVPYRAGVVR